MPKHNPSKHTHEEKQKYNQERMAEIAAILKQEMEKLYSGETYRKWLETAALFPNYSVNNQILIMTQRPDATNVCAMGNWNKLNRTIKPGSKGIKIIAPVPYHVWKEKPMVDENGEIILDNDGNEKKHKVRVERMTFRPVYVFDISDTKGDPLPSLCIDEIKGSVEHFNELMNSLKQVSPVPISVEPIDGTAKGYFDLTEQKIVIKDGMDELAIIKTCIHEIAHALLHDAINGSRLEDLDETKTSRGDKEMQAESIAYIVSRRLGYDVSDYSVGYVCGWQQDPYMKQFEASLNTITTTASYILSEMEKHLSKELEKQKPELQHEVPESQLNDTEQALLNNFIKQVSYEPVTTQTQER